MSSAIQAQHPSQMTDRKPSALGLSRYRMLAPTASVRVSPLCLGAMTFGESNPERYGKITKKDAFDMMDLFYTSGGNFIDTANAYRAGASEEWVGEWMKQKGNRDEIVLATKYSSPYMTHEKGRIQANYGGNGTKNMRQSIEGSLRRLQTDSIDLYYVHWWDYTATIPEVMHALNDLVTSGKVSYLGISDAPAWIVSKANQYARDHGLRQFVVYQGLYNVASRDMERDIIPMCIDEGMGICPYATLGQGRFHTKQGYEEREKDPDRRNLIPLSEHDKTVSAQLEKIAERKGCQLLDVALQYVRFKTPYVFPIVGGRKVSHIQGSIASLDVDLSDEDMIEVEKAYDFDPGFPHTFLSGALFNGDPNDNKGGHAPEDMWLLKSLGTTEYVPSNRPMRPVRGDALAYRF